MEKQVFLKEQNLGITYQMIRCKNWNGPYKIPMFNQSGIAARTDWLIQDNKTALIMLTTQQKLMVKKVRIFHV